MGINASQLANQISYTLKQYTKEVYEELEELKEEVSKSAVQELKSSSPRKTGDYGKGWRIVKQNGAYVIHNATDYQLTHLLEKGHAKRNGGRVAPKPHIQPVEDHIIKNFENGVERVLGK